MILQLYYGVSKSSGVPLVAESETTFWVKAFNWYFVVINYFAVCLKDFFMIYFLKFDILFTLLVSIFWLAPPTFNLAFMLASDEFRANFVQRHMWFLWSLLFLEGLMIIVDWQL